MKDKIKVLVIPSDTMGVGHFRSIWPGIEINKSFGDEIDVEINHKPNIANLEYFQSFDIIHFHRHIGPYEESAEFFPKIKEAGVKLIMDIDDFWEPPSTHPLYEIAKRDKLSEKISGNLSLVDCVTTTTEVFANEIRKHNKNVYVIPNALNMEHKMWTGELHENKTDRCRISWIGGSSHLHDLELMRPGFNKLWNDKELEDKFQIIMCGFDTRGTITEMKPNGEGVTRPIKPHETVWLRFEEIFTANHKGKSKDPEYYKWLNKIKKPKSSDYKDEQYIKDYVRRWTLPLTKYGNHYDYADVCLAPLVDVYEDRIVHTKKDGSQSIQIEKKRHTFNEVKSELKIIEAGMKGKVLIAQDFGIYKELIEDGVTGLLVKNDKKDWYRHMKTVIKDPVYRQELADNLHNFVKEKYDITNVTADRVKFYKEILKEKDKPVEKVVKKELEKSK